VDTPRMMYQQKFHHCSQQQQQQVRHFIEIQLSASSRATTGCTH
jgi:hypothetical protein